MSARILVVDDLAMNRRMLEALLAAEYFEVTTAASGTEALSLAEGGRFDIVLLDVMMPGMDGFEVCRRLKAGAETQHVPVVLVTALDRPEHRLAGLEAGADDFLTKPVGKFALLSRIRALTRLKMTTDEIRARLDVVSSAALRRELHAELTSPGTDGAIVAIVGSPAREERLRAILGREQRVVFSRDDGDVLAACRDGRVDVAIIDLSATGFDPLRLCSQLRSNTTTRHLPILLLAEQTDEVRLRQAMEIGASDYATQPLDACEIAVRARAQVRRRRFDETLRRSVKRSAELAVLDPLTDLYNRRFMDAALAELAGQARDEGRHLSVFIADLDHFKQINDQFGHDAGDAVLREFARCLRGTVRAGDVACRYGGEEFVVVMMDAALAEACAAAERLRDAVAREALGPVGGRRLTVSVGVASMDLSDDVELLLKRADEGLYRAKALGRDRVIANEAEPIRLVSPVRG